MSQYTNPITNKLSKNSNKYTENSRFKTQEQQTPIKTTDRIRADIHHNKENIGIMPFESQSHLSNSSSLRKISLLQKKSNRKHTTTSFYQRQLMRRKQKYQNQLIEMQEKFQNQLMSLQKQLISNMSEQQQLDRQISVLSQLKQIFLNHQQEDLNQNYLKKCIQNFNQDTLYSLNRLLIENNEPISESSFDDFTYTLETITEDMKQSIPSKKMSEQLLLDETLEYYFSKR